MEAYFVKKIVDKNCVTIHNKLVDEKYIYDGDPHMVRSNSNSEFDNQINFNKGLLKQLLNTKLYTYNDILSMSIDTLKEALKIL